MNSVTEEIVGGDISEKHENNRRPYGTCERTEKLLKKLSVLTPDISIAEKRCLDLRNYINERSRQAAAGARDYPKDSMNLDGENLVHEEGRLQNLIQRRNKIENTIRILHLKRLVPLYEELTHDLEDYCTESVPFAICAIEAYQNLREALRHLSAIERKHESRRESAGNIRGMLASLDPSHIPTMGGANLPASATDLLNRMIDGLRAYSSGANIYNIRVSDFDGLGDDFEFDGDEEDVESSEVEIAIAGNAENEDETNS